MKHRAVVLGCGRIGATMVRDLASDPDYEVVGADVSEHNLWALQSLPRVTTARADLSDPAELTRLCAPCDVVLGALPSRLGLRALQTVIDVGRPYCDVSFMPEDALSLDETARKRGVTAVVDCGVAPGLSNLIVGHVHGHLDRTDRAVIYVGGLPRARRLPFEYQAPFAPSDVIEEYIRPARVVRQGRVVVLPALAEPEYVDFPRIGTLEAFVTDGLRSLAGTLRIPEMTEKTLRYPGHLTLVRALREAGYFDKQPTAIGDAAVRPFDLSVALLSKAWAFTEGEEDLTVMRVVVQGVKDSARSRYIFDLFDAFDHNTGTSSMARVTAFPATILARLLASGRLADPGVRPPELLAGHDRPQSRSHIRLFEYVRDELHARGVQLHERIEQDAERP